MKKKKSTAFNNNEHTPDPDKINKQYIFNSNEH